METQQPQNIDFGQVAMKHNQEERLSMLRPEKLFMLLLGPSAVGKSAIIRELKRAHPEIGYTYIEPYTTRQLRENETDKIHVSDADFDRMEADGQFVFVNDLYGVRYGTPLNTIQQAFAENGTPILDFPLDKVDKLANPNYDLLNIYVFPSTLDEWKGRLEAEGRNKSGRYEQGIAELEALAYSSEAHPDIHFSVVNGTGNLETVAEGINSRLQMLKTNTTQ